MIILDTNVLSEVMNPQSSASVLAWIRAQNRSQLFVTAITQAEILYGIAILPEGAKKQRLDEAALDLFDRDFLGMILPFEQNAAKQFATLFSYRRAKGNPISQSDAQIAAICLAHQATIATRNVKDFNDCQIEVVNPWEA